MLTVSTAVLEVLYVQVNLRRYHAYRAVNTRCAITPASMTSRSGGVVVGVPSSVAPSGGGSTVYHHLPPNP